MSAEQAAWVHMYLVHDYSSTLNNMNKNLAAHSRFYDSYLISVFYFNFSIH